MVACSSLNEASAQAAAGVADIEPGDELTHIDDVQVSDASMVIVQDAIQVPLLILISGRACCTLHGSEVTPCGPSCQGPQGTEVKLSFKKENGQVYHTSLARGPGQLPSRAPLPTQGEQTHFWYRLYSDCRRGLHNRLHCTATMLLLALARIACPSL